MASHHVLTSEHRDAILELIEEVVFDFIDQLRKGESLCLRTVMTDGKVHSIKLTLKNVEKFALIVRALALIHNKLVLNSMATRRDVFYEQKRLYGSQRMFDASVTSICRLLNCTRRDLNLLSTSRGLMIGKLLFDDGISCQGATLSVQESLLTKRVLEVGRFVLVVEKDATFQKLLQENFTQLFPEALLVTGRGYPDICTRNVVRSIVETANIPCFCLTDADPHGVAIFMTYKYGAETPSAVNENCFIPDIIWLGMLPSDAKQLPIDGDQFLRLQPGDKKRVNALLGRALTLNELTVVEELQLMVREDFKLELEAISGISDGYMSKFYIPQCLQRLGYL
uniref:DNA topoisomerase (ATP-hydrolyzing) n=1 Tax=Steinernema glaseri TaxID=37863 RepID=A0A1I7Z0R6_9BILA